MAGRWGSVMGVMTREQQVIGVRDAQDVRAVGVGMPDTWTAAEWEQLVAALTRRRFLVGGAGLLALGALAACGGGDDGAQPTVTPTVTSRTISTPRGDVVVPVAPQRIVALLYADGVLLDVGLTPIGVQMIDESTLLPEQVAALQDVQQVTFGAENEIDVEQVAKLQPDLILGAFRAGTEIPYDALSVIAPTVIFDLASAAEVREQTIVIADVVGRRAEAEQWRADYQARIAEIQAAHAEKIARTRWSLVNGFTDDWVAYATHSWGGSILTDLGLTFGRAGADVVERSGAFYSLEQLNVLDDNDVILHFANNDGTFPETTATLVDRLETTPAALKEGAQIHPLRYFFADRYRTAIELINQIDTILAGLA